MRSAVRTFLLTVLLSICGVVPAVAQLRLSASQPNIDSFPVVRIGVGVTLDGITAPTLDTSDFALRSDGVPVSNFELVNCDAPLTAAIAIVVDTSASMKQSVGTGSAPNFSYTAFRRSFSSLVSRVPSGSFFTVVPFADSASYSYPRAAPYFYNSAVDPDTTELLQTLRSLKFDTAGTFVDAGILYAASLLRTVSVSRRVIILITDDYIDDESQVTKILQANSISLFVMQVRPDSGIVVAPNRDIAKATAGDYLEAPDSSCYAPVMATIADEIFSTHCTIRYLDVSNCPWLKQHDLDLTLTYQSQRASAHLQYTVGPNILDSTPPLVAIDSAQPFIRTVLGRKDYPCLAALDSAGVRNVTNFRPGKLSIKPDSLWLPLNVIDTLYAADADVTVTDVNGNSTVIHVHYSPKPDTNGPQFDAANISSGACQVWVHERLPWDRGIASVMLEPGSLNLVVDQIKYYRKDSASVFLHMHDVSTLVNGCLLATDSAGNKSKLCFTYDPTAPDQLPPLLTQDPLTEPRLTLSGTVTEHRPNDTGIRDAIVSPGPNAANSSVVIRSSREYALSTDLLDSLYRAVVYVDATDSAGNTMHDSLEYLPLPDTLHPVILTSLAGDVIDVSVRETRGWDRGIQSVSFGPSPTNISVTGTAYSDARNWSATLKIADTTAVAGFTITAIDSANNVVTEPVVIQPRPSQPIDYMGDSIVDFGTHLLPISMQKSIVIRNTNKFAVTVTVSSPVGDDSVFSLVNPNSFPLGVNNAEVLTFSWFPHSAGRWKAVYTLYAGSEKIGTITVLGVSVTEFTLVADTVRSYPGELGNELHVRVQSDPTPLNVDTIRFRLNFNGDVVDLLDPSCSGDLCSYTLDVVRQRNALNISLTQPAHSPVVLLDLPSAVLTFPVRTFVAVEDSTPVWFSDVYSDAGYAGDTLDGMVYSLDTCGTGELRHYLMGSPFVDIVGVSPNPTVGETTLQVSSSASELAELRWIDALGHCVQSTPLDLALGKHSYTISAPGVSGSYTIELSLPGAPPVVRRVQVVR